MNDLNEWLDSLSSNSSTSEVQTPAPSDNDVSTSQEESTPQALSSQDFDDILGDFGFSRPEDAQAEEIMEEDENNRDLDAEEDADWQEAIDSGGVVPVEFDPASVADQEIHFHMPDGNVAAVPIVQEESLSEPQDIPAEYQEPLIPINSPTLLMDDSTTRFSGAEWYNEIQKQSIIIAGLGGIGSWLTLQLARMHPYKMVLYDDDRVEAVNMAGQMYAMGDVGKTKAEAMYDMVFSYTTMQNVYALTERFTANIEAGDVMMCGFDNMEARKTFFEAWHNHVYQKPTEERNKCLYLDGRLSMDTLQVFCITGDDFYDQEKYITDYLFSDEEAEHTVCSMKQTTYLACMIGSIMVNLFTNWAANLLNPIIPYDLPFFTEYDSQNMIFKTIK